MTETVDAFYQETNYVTLLFFWLLIDVCFLLLHVSFIFDCLVYFFHYSVLRVRFYNKIIIIIIIIMSRCSPLTSANVFDSFLCSLRTFDNVIAQTLAQIKDKLFSLMFRSCHCLHTLLPDLEVTDIVLRNSGTSFNLPHCSYKLYKQSL